MRVLAIVGVCVLGLVAGRSSAQSREVPEYYRAQEPLTEKNLFPECRGWFLGDLKEPCDKARDHLQYLEQQLLERCMDAGEHIVQKVTGVEGVYVKSLPPTPKWRYSSNHFHRDDTSYSSYVWPQRANGYLLYETGHHRLPNIVVQTRVSSIDGTPRNATFSSRESTIPEAKYEISVRYLTTDKEQQHGLFGEEVVIKDIPSGATIATRKFFYYIVENHIYDRNGYAVSVPKRSRTIRACPNYSPELSDRYTDRRPRESYDFVSRVLEPK